MNVNKKQYRLDGSYKQSKEYAQDFLEDYNERSPKVNDQQRRPSLISSKTYESDANNNSDEKGGQHATTMQTIEDEEEFLFYNSRKRTLVEKMCQCLFPYYSHPSGDASP
jgi:hypothetical protein